MSSRVALTPIEKSGTYLCSVLCVVFALHVARRRHSVRPAPSLISGHCGCRGVVMTPRWQAGLLNLRNDRQNRSASCRKCKEFAQSRAVTARRTTRWNTISLNQYLLPIAKSGNWFALTGRIYCQKYGCGHSLLICRLVACRCESVGHVISECRMA